MHSSAITRRTCWMLAWVAGLLLSGSRTFAQSPFHIHASAEVGTAAGNGGEFFDRNFGAARLAIGASRAVHPGLSLETEISYDWLGLVSGHDAVCRISSRGGCVEPYPALGGPSAAVGIGVALGTAGEIRGLVGGAAYSVDGTRVGAAVTQLDLSGFLTQHFGLVSSFRNATVPRYQHDRLSINQWLFGLRVR